MKTMNLKYSVILISILGIILLYSLTLFSQPQQISIANVEQYEGQTIIVNGTITNTFLTTYGSQIVELTQIENNTVYELVVFLEEPLILEYGDSVEITGSIQQYQDEWELYVQNNRLIRILEKWNNITIHISQLSKHPSAYIGINLNTTGIIDRIYDQYFYLIDPTEEYTLPVFHNNQNSTIYEGETVFIYGKFEYDENTLRYGIYLNDESPSIFREESTID